MAVTYTASTVKNTPHFHQGATFIKLEVEVPADAFDTDADAVLLLYFGENAQIPVGFYGTSAFVAWTDDLDSDGTPALDLHFGLGDSDGAIDTALVTGTDIGQAATADAGDELDATGVTLANQGYIDCSGKYLIAHAITAAATGAAGTIKVSMVVVNGVVTASDDLTE